MKKLLSIIAVSVVVLFAAKVSKADPLVWNLPGGMGTVGLPFQSTEVIPIGYDLVLKQEILGASLPILNVKNLVYGQVGAVGVFNSQSLNAQPYLALGLDLLRYVPTLNQFKSAHLNGFGRWATDQGKPGAGISFSYSFGGPAVAP